MAYKIMGFVADGQVPVVSSGSSRIGIMMAAWHLSGTPRASPATASVMTGLPRRHGEHPGRRGGRPQVTG